MFANRREAGELLAERLRGESHPTVIGISRGGVIVAESVARSLSAPLDVVVVRKVGHPLQPELALGAVCASGEYAVTAYASEFPAQSLRPLFEAQATRARATEATLRGGEPSLDLTGCTAIVVDDGVATSATMSCAIAHVRRAGAARIVGAAPVAPADSCAQLARACDEFVVLMAPRDRDFAVGRYYVDFREVDDRMVTDAVSRMRSPG